MFRVKYVLKRPELDDTDLHNMSEFGGSSLVKTMMKLAELMLDDTKEEYLNATDEKKCLELRGAMDKLTAYILKIRLIANPQKPQDE